MIWADLHLHSPHAIATSKHMTPGVLALAARRKGLGLLATADALHPAWRATLRRELIPDGTGFYRWSGDPQGVGFVVGGEVNLVWRQNDKARRVHLLYFLPGLDEADALAKALEPHGKLASDGRPTLKLSAAEFLVMVKDVAPDAALVAAHVWTPWFGLLGARSGFDSVDEALGDAAPLLGALETGLSSDPPMSRRVSSLDRHPLVSFSDAHGPAVLGREATGFAILPDFATLSRALHTGKGIAATLEFPPAEGKYYHDGHRNCGVSAAPSQGLRVCPVCGKPLTRGVLGRVQDLADRAPADALALSLPHRHVVPLQTLAAAALGVGKSSKAVQRLVDGAIEAAGSELAALLDADPATLPPPLGPAVTALRQGRYVIEPGFDGEYGKFELTDR